MNLFLFGLFALVVTECYTKDLRKSKEESDQEAAIERLDTIAMMAEDDADFMIGENRKLKLNEPETLLINDQRKNTQLGSESTDTERRLSREKRKALRDTKYRWTGKVIPFEIALNEFSRKHSRYIHKAINHWQNYTCLRFTPRTTQANYVYFQKGHGCSSDVGMVKGKQTIVLDAPCMGIRTLLHEIGHAVGFVHEHMRPDRDSYIKIISDHIPKPIRNNFGKLASSQINSHGVPYDYNSVMHYSKTLGGNTVIETVDRTYQDKIGHSQKLSFYDIKLANLMYSCDESCAPGTVCPDEGFVGKDCKCYCPGDPVRLCRDSAWNGRTSRVTTSKTEGSIQPIQLDTRETLGLVINDIQRPAQTKKPQRLQDLKRLPITTDKYRSEDYRQF
ncbi:low choriolytic enzyme-like [Elysia marginata]|uniref:Metalloendopeptidase n=1 Tax=Elysia marginata TaxID=1093978 RepID=A0AAV4JQZ4_9GAST|nr:low choriolytic enzyme-like [Elysia marginata]